MSFDLSTIEGLDEETKAKIEAMHEDEVKGLKNSKDTILSEKHQVSTQLDEAKRDAEEARAEALELQGKFKEANELRLSLEKAKTQAETDKLEIEQQSKERIKGLLVSQEVDKLRGQILLGVDPKMHKLAESLLQHSVVSGDLVDDKVVTSIKLGDTEFSSVEEFLGGAKDDDIWRNLVAVGESNGGGGNGGAGSGGADTNHAFNKAVENNDLGGILDSAFSDLKK